MYLGFARQLADPPSATRPRPDPSGRPPVASASRLCELTVIGLPPATDPTPHSKQTFIFLVLLIGILALRTGSREPWAVVTHRGGCGSIGSGSNVGSAVAGSAPRCGPTAVRFPAADSRIAVTAEAAARGSVHRVDDDRRAAKEDMQPESDMDRFWPGSVDEQFACQIVGNSGDGAAVPPPLPALRVAGVLATSKARRPTDITIVTQLSMDRLPMLQALCGTWASRVSAAIYLPLLAGGHVLCMEPDQPEEPRLVPLEATQRMLSSFHKTAEAKGACMFCGRWVGKGGRGPRGARRQGTHPARTPDMHATHALFLP